MKNKGKTKRQLERELSELRIQIAQRDLFEMQKTWVLKRIKAERYRLSELIDKTPLGITIIDDDYRIKFQNAVAQRAFGKSIEKLCYKAYKGKATACEECILRKAISLNCAIQAKQRLVNGQSYRLIASPFRGFSDKNNGVLFTADVVLGKTFGEKTQPTAKEVMSSAALQRMILKDPSTGLYNDRYLRHIIAAEFSRSKRYMSPLSLLMLDVTYDVPAKEGMSRHHHELLNKHFATRLKKLIRRSDIAIRSGVDEFTIITPASDLQGAKILARRVLQIPGQLKKHPVSFKLNVSVVSYPGKGNFLKGSDLISKARQLLNKHRSDRNKMHTISDDEISRKPDKKRELTRYLKGQVEGAIKSINNKLIKELYKLARAAARRDGYQEKHLYKTAYYSTKIAEALKLSHTEIENIEKAAVLHDLGKIKIDQHILKKPGKLDQDEFDRLKNYPRIGADLINSTGVLDKVAPLVLYHRERWDRKGYPESIGGEQIPLGARIIAITDAYQSMVSDRPYRKAYPKRQAMTTIESESGTYFDPAITDIFLDFLRK